MAQEQGNHAIAGILLKAIRVTTEDVVEGGVACVLARDLLPCAPHTSRRRARDHWVESRRTYENREADFDRDDDRGGYWTELCRVQRKRRRYGRARGLERRP